MRSSLFLFCRARVLIMYVLLKTGRILRFVVLLNYKIYRRQYLILCHFRNKLKSVSQEQKLYLKYFLSPVLSPNTRPSFCINKYRKHLELMSIRTVED